MFILSNKINNKITRNFFSINSNSLKEVLSVLQGLFVHEKHAQRKDLPRFAGWWNHNKETRFNMRQPFDVMEGAEGWQLSNPPILSMAAIKASLDIFEKVGMDVLVKKSKKLTGFFEYLVNEIASDTIKIITPTNPNERGCQLSLQVKNADKNLHKKYRCKGNTFSWRAKAFSNYMALLST